MTKQLPMKLKFCERCGALITRRGSSRSHCSLVCRKNAARIKSSFSFGDPLTAVQLRTLRFRLSKIRTVRRLDATARAMLHADLAHAVAFARAGFVRYRNPNGPVQKHALRVLAGDACGALSAAGVHAGRWRNTDYRSDSAYFAVIRACCDVADMHCPRDLRHLTRNVPKQPIFRPI